MANHKKEPIKAGQSYRAKYPFCRCEIDTFDEEGWPSGRMVSWRPGVNLGSADPDGFASYATCDKEGYVIYEVISTHKPGKYPERVFYTRKYISPADNEFGKPGLKITTTANFRRLIKGCRYEYEVLEADEDA